MSGLCPTCRRIYTEDYDDRLGGVVSFDPGEAGRRVWAPSVHIEWHHPGAAMELAACVKSAVAWMKRHDVDGTVQITRTLGHLRVVLEPWRPD